MSLITLICSAFAWEPIDDGGVAVSWPSGNPETVWQISSNYPSADMNSSAVQTAFANGINEWSTPGCTSFNASQGNNTSASPGNFTDSYNTVGFFETNWPSSYGQNTLAITLPMYYLGSEEIISADMIYNGEDFDFMNGTPAVWDDADLQSVAAHEFGHWIGFDHSNYPGSTLTASYSGGTSERTLTCDDTEGVCETYPSSGNSCSSDNHCPCDSYCNNGTCSGGSSNGGGNNGGGGSTSTCNGSISETRTETEPNDWTSDGEYTGLVSNNDGDMKITGSITCGNNGEQYTADVDWFVTQFDCSSNARFVLDWNGNADLDFYVYDSNGDFLVGSDSAESSGPIYEEAAAGDLIFIYVACWEGSSTNYTFTIDWTPYSTSTSQPSSEPSNPSSEPSNPSSEPSSPTSEPNPSSPSSEPSSPTSEPDSNGGGNKDTGAVSGCSTIERVEISIIAVLLSILGLRNRRRNQL